MQVQAVKVARKCSQHVVALCRICLHESRLSGILDVRRQQDAAGAVAAGCRHHDLRWPAISEGFVYRAANSETQCRMNANTLCTGNYSFAVISTRFERG